MTMWWFLVTLCLLNVFSWIGCYNIDLDYPIIIEDPDSSVENSYFGYSLVLYGDKDKKWIKIGAPTATYNGTAKGSAHRSGVVYHCPFKTSACKIDENFSYTSKRLTNSFFGGTMDISDDYKTVGVSASKWQFLKVEDPNTPGAIFIENLANENVQEPYFLKAPLSFNTYSYYLRSSAGVSLNFVANRNELLVGAPGVYNYLGTVLRIKDVDKSQSDWKVEAIHPSGGFNEYAGYAVVSGKFYNKKEVYYVSGVPRGAEQRLHEIPIGSVIVFSFRSDPPRGDPTLKHTFQSKIRAQLNGLQFGEYFGSALAAGDLNGDGLDDLVVGAPFRSNSKHGYNQGSVYIFYGNIGKLKYDPKNRIDNMETGSRFGTAMMVLSDLDQEGFPELAISAPGEETSGVVYIYTFDHTTKIMKESQKILGKHIYPGLRGFGTSFSKAMDIDDNNFKDFAVGSPISRHVVILRSKPLVLVHPKINVSSSLSKFSNILSFQCCYNFTEFIHPNLTIIRHIRVDKDFGRFYFNSNRNFEEKRMNIKRNQTFCETLNLTKGNIKNYNDPISITLTYKVPDHQPSTIKRSPVIIRPNGSWTGDSFCKKCPILSKRSKLIVTKLVVWDHNCDHNGRKEPCKSKLEVDARFINLQEENIFTLGTEDLIHLEITVANQGDPAFSPLLHIGLPNGVLLINWPIDCENNDNHVACNIGNVLNEKVTYNLKFSININEIDDLVFFFNASTITDNINDRSTLNLRLKLKREADFLITGYSKESSYLYESDKLTLIQNVFKIEKFGPSPTPPTKAGILIPYSIKGADETYVQFTRIIDGNETALENSLITCGEIVQDFVDTSKKIPKQSVNEIKIFHLNCSMENIKCIYLQCLIGSLDSLQNHAEIAVNMEVDFMKLNTLLGKEWLMKTDQIIITTGASISADGFIQTGNRSDHTELSNVLLTNKQFTISLWILIGSVIIGLIILVVMTVVLKKAGFFVREKHLLLRQIKEDDQLIEELIQKELEKEESFDVELRDTLLDKETGENSTVKSRKS